MPETLNIFMHDLRGSLRASHGVKLYEPPPSDILLFTDKSHKYVPAEVTLLKMLFKVYQMLWEETDV